MNRHGLAVAIVATLVALAAGPALAQTSAPSPATAWRPEVPDDPPGRWPALPPPGVLLAPAPVVQDEFTSVQVNVDAFGDNIPGDAANEPSIAVDPTDPDTMAIGWRQFDTVTSNFRQAGVAHTSDGGQTWTFPGVLDPGQFRSDPVLASDPDGTFFYSSLSTLSSIEVFVSTDGGVSWPTMVSAFGGDKQWFTADRTTGIGSGNLYQVWNVQFTCCPPNDFTRSTNGGASFESPLALPLPSMKWGTLDVGPDGTLYAAGATLSLSGHLFTRSPNAQDPGQTPAFAPVQAVSLGGATAHGTGPNPGGLLGQVWVATDHSSGPTAGNVYLLGSMNPPGPDPLDVMLVRSEDGGSSWSAPIRVNDDPAAAGVYQWFGTLAVAPNGRIDVAWNDTRADPMAAFSELYYAYSVDGGATWTSNVPLSPPFDHSLGYPNQNKLGDYYQMVSEDTHGNLAYAATFNGEQDVYYVRVAPDCNGNGIHDGTDVLDGPSFDWNGDGIPDECQFEVPALPGIGVPILVLGLLGIGAISGRIRVNPK